MLGAAKGRADKEMSAITQAEGQGHTIYNQPMPGSRSAVGKLTDWVQKGCMERRLEILTLFAAGPHAPSSTEVWLGREQGAQLPPLLSLESVAQGNQPATKRDTPV